MKFLFLAVALTACPILGHAQSSFTCPTGYEDMMNYFVMAYPNRVDNHMGPGNANAVYSAIFPDDNTNNYAASGYFLWIKSPSGYPWDIKTFDTQYVYDRATELGWTDPTSFKRFDKDLPMTRRCLPVWAGATVAVQASGSTYQSFSQCQSYLRQPLGYVLNQTSAPMTAYIDNIGFVPTRYFTYNYTCNRNYASCKYREVFSLGYGIGLYDWKYYVNQHGKFVLQQESVINNMEGGQTTPSLPCTNSYQ
ncbi:MAG: hypothetical protein ACRD2U_08825 [Terriglobales bacterium]